MGLNESQGELGYLADQLFDAAMFLSPLFDLRQQIHRDISGVGLGFELPGEVVARVLLPTGAAAIRIATGTADVDEAGSQDGAIGLELFLAGLEEAADQGGMFGRFHTLGRATFVARITE